MSLWSYGGRLIAVGALIGVSLACGTRAATGDVDKIQIETSQVAVTVKNVSGGALVDLTIAIIPAGRTTSYTKRLERMESGETRDLFLAVFSDRDHVAFSLRVARPSSVSVDAKTVHGDTLRVEVPWK